MVLLAACVIFVVTGAATAGYYAYLNAHPEILATFVEEAIAKRLGRVVTVEKSDCVAGMVAPGDFNRCHNRCAR